MTESSYSKSNVKSTQPISHNSRLSWRSLALGLSCLSGVGLLVNRAIAYEEFSIPFDNEPLESYNTYTPEPEPYYAPPVQESYIAPEPYYEPEPYYAPPVQESYIAPE
ncbi:MAG: M23 family peptidase, partial [Limnospira sp. PMC 1279.21]|nr:M23 family peptidase [Limnospira sp. PMC 1279.21]MDY7055121.1 M23 family peptidase [Limnospira fusiformis LS22]